MAVVLLAACVVRLRQLLRLVVASSRQSSAIVGWGADTFTVCRLEFGSSRTAEPSLNLLG
jgi:hypothetical protein